MDEFFSKDYEHAIEDFSLALELADDDPMSYFRRGMAYMEIEKINEALGDFQKAGEFGLRIPEDFIVVALREVRENTTFFNNAF
jgi:tetratricopeptide (TPR) repeat protein